MKRNFADYVLYFAQERTAEGCLARLVKEDPDFPVRERDDKVVYTYLINAERYAGYKEAIIYLYHRYLVFSR